MANEFKAAAERKKRLSELRKAEKTIGQIENFMVERRDVLSVGAAETLQNAADKLSEVIKDTNADPASIAALNDEAQTAYDVALNTLEKQPESQTEEAPAENEGEAHATESVETEPENTDTPKEEVPAEEISQESIEPEEEKVADILHRMYAAPRSSLGGTETKIRFSALIKPSLKAKMDKDAKAGKIISQNDLINVLLEIYYGEE